MKDIRSMANDWKNGKIYMVDRYLSFLEKKLTSNTIKYIRQIENLLCDPEYIIDYTLLDVDPYKQNMKYSNITFWNN